MKKIIAMMLCAALTLCCVPAAAYSDVAEDVWYADAVAFCEARGLMDGMGDGTFAPYAAVTRAQLVTALWRMAGKPAAKAPSGFRDVAEDAWYAGAVAWAVEAAVTDGMGDGSFAPDMPLTREMLVTFFHRFAGAPAMKAAADFADAADISGWAREAAAWAQDVGLVQGKGGGVFDPKGGAVRAELAKVLQGYLAAGVGTVLRAYTLSKGSAPVAAIYDDEDLLVVDSFFKVIWRFYDDYAELAVGDIAPADPQGEPYGGYLDGPIELASFASPYDIAPFMDGFAVSDPGNNTVRLVRSGNVQTLNGVKYNQPTGLAAGDDGVLYVANTGAGEVLRVTPEGKSSVFVSGLDGPTGLAFAGGALYVAETDAGNVWRVTANGSKTLVRGGFFGPTGLAVGDDGTVYVADTADAAVYAVSPTGTATPLLQRADGQTLEVWPAAPTGLLLRDGVLTVCDRFAGVLVDINVAY